MPVDAQQRQRLLVIIALICVGLLFADRLLFRPYFRAFAARAERIQQLKTQLSRGELLLGRAESLKQRWAEMQRNSLPADRSKAEGLIFSAINRWRSESGVTFNSLISNWRDIDQRHSLFEWRITASGSLSQLTRFLYAIETDPIAVKVEEAQLAAEDEKGSRLRLNVTITFLQLKGGAEQPDKRSGQPSQVSEEQTMRET